MLLSAPSEGATPTPTPTPQPVDPELLEAITSAMRAVIQKLAHLGSPKFAEVSVADVHFLVHLAEGAASSVQIHIMRIVATIALLLVKVQPQHAVVQVGGTFVVMPLCLCVCACLGGGGSTLFTQMMPRVSPCRPHQQHGPEPS